MPIFTKRTKKEDVPVAQPAGFGNRTPEQIREALDKAHKARRDSADFLSKVKAKEITLHDILEGSEAENPVAKGLLVRTLLRALPGTTPLQADRVIDRIGIVRGRHVRGLGDRQRAQLLDWRSQNMPAEGEE